jgi:hypothetical protein
MESGLDMGTGAVAQCVARGDEHKRPGHTTEINRTKDDIFLFCIAISGKYHLFS